MRTKLPHPRLCSRTPPLASIRGKEDTGPEHGAGVVRQRKVRCNHAPCRHYDAT